MWTYLKKLAARRSPPRRPGLRPSLERLESRLALAATPSVPLPPPVAALVAAPVPHTGSDGGLRYVLPERPVHGYKWRPRWPHAATTTPAILQPTHGTTAHLIAGGAGQALVTISSQGHVVVHPPEGPLPTDLKAIGQRS